MGKRDYPSRKAERKRYRQRHKKTPMGRARRIVMANRRREAHLGPLPKSEERRAYLYLKAVLSAELMACEYCGVSLLSRERSIDHRTPVREGGRGVVENLACVCKTCNNKKSWKPIGEIGWNRDRKREMAEYFWVQQRSVGG